MAAQGEQARKGLLLTPAARKIKESYKKTSWRAVPRINGLPDAPASPLEGGFPRAPPIPQGDPAAAGEVKKKLSQKVASARRARPGLEVLVMFEDEAQVLV